VFLPYQFAGALDRRAGRDAEGNLGDEVQRGVTADLALEESREGGPGDDVLLLIPADALQADRGTHDVRSTVRVRAEYRLNDQSGLRPPRSFALAGCLARGLVEDAGPTLDREARVLPAGDLAGEVGIKQTLVEERGYDAAWTIRRFSVPYGLSLPSPGIPIPLGRDGAPRAEAPRGCRSRVRRCADAR
jgi:hypothetical protein